MKKIFNLCAGILLLLPCLVFAQQIDSTESRYFTEFHKGPLKERTLRYKSANGTTEVKTNVVEDQLVVEGDIVVGPANEMMEKAVVIDNVTMRILFMTFVLKDYRWPNGQIPYVIERNHPKRSLIIQAINDVNQQTVLSMVPRRKQKNYVFFRWSGNNGPANSPVGMQGGKQTINIPGWASKGNTIHEIFHSAGMFHEQSRCDRDNHVTINYGNIQSGASGNFSKKCGSKGTDIGRYNFNSIMHYGAYAFSKNNRKTIVTHGGQSIGQRSYISYYDKQALNVIY